MEHDSIVITSDRQTGERSWNFPVERVVVPEFEIYANPTVRLDEIVSRRFSLIERYK